MSLIMDNFIKPPVMYLVNTIILIRFLLSSGLVTRNLEDNGVSVVRISVPTHIIQCLYQLSQVDGNFNYIL